MCKMSFQKLFASRKNLFKDFSHMKIWLKSKKGLFIFFFSKCTPHSRESI